MLLTPTGGENGWRPLLQSPEGGECYEVGLLIIDDHLFYKDLI